MNYKFVLSLFVLSSLVLFTGCGKNIKVGGKVTFADDGSPLTCGTIVFDNGQEAGRGVIQSDGSYLLGFDKINNGIPKGNYKVYIIGAVEKTQSKSGINKLTGKVEETMADIKVKNLIDVKYRQASSSDLTTTIEGPNLQCDFKVARAK